MEKMLEGEKLLTAGDVAFILNVSKWKFYKMLVEEKIPYIKVGNRIRVSPKDLQQWIEDRKDGDK